jgi:hypothetical protein
LNKTTSRLHEGTLLFVCLLLAASSSRAYLGTPQEDAGGEYNTVTGPGYVARASSVIEKNISNGTTALEVTYSYEFTGRSSVYITGIGVSEPKGSLSYIVFESAIEFRESQEGTVLAKLPLKETGRTMGDDSTDLPKEADFLENARSGTWKGPGVFSSTAINVIQKYFPLGYAARNKNAMDYYITSYRGLEVPDVQLRSQIALIVSHPYDKTNKQFSYHVQFVARDRPRMSSSYRYGDDRSQETLDAAAVFVNRLMTELSDGKGGNR